MNWGMLALQALVTILGTLIPLFLFLYADKKATKTEGDRRHEQNTEKLNRIIMVHEYLPPHSHGETSGPLYAEGIIPRKRNH